MNLEERLAAIGRSLVEREADHEETMQLARLQIESLHAQVRRALTAYHGAVAPANHYGLTGAAG